MATTSGVVSTEELELDKYAWYIGNPIPSASLWVRRDGLEHPIYSNTRGQGVFYSFDTNEYENTEVIELSSAFVEWLAHYHRYRNDLIQDSGMFWADAVEEDKPDGSPEWYEIEFLNAIGKPSVTGEVVGLMEWAYNRVE